MMSVVAWPWETAPAIPEYDVPAPAAGGVTEEGAITPLQ